MRIAEVEIENFRCLRNVRVRLDALTVLIGANGSGKSSILNALDWFFEGGGLDAQDICASADEQRLSVRVTFDELSALDSEVLGRYAAGATATFWRMWSPASGEKLTGKAKALPAFESIRAESGATLKRSTYNDLRSSRPELGLPTAPSAAAVEQALMDWELAHPLELEDAEISATHLFGFAGEGKLRDRFEFVLVPAVADINNETRHARGTLLHRLVEKLAQVKGGEDLEALQHEYQKRVAALYQDRQGGALVELSSQVSTTLGEWVDGVGVALSLGVSDVRLPDPIISVAISDGGVETDVARQGHGLQRALLIALLQQLASLQSEIPERAPSLLLAVEEPELFQHPTQARHFARVLQELCGEEQGRTQVVLATHSPYFIDAGDFASLRRVQKSASVHDESAETEVSYASAEQVIARLHGWKDAGELLQRVRMTLQRTLGEAVFARAVVLVEGTTDAAIIHGLADAATVDLDARGIAVVDCHGKSVLPVAVSVLGALQIPTFVVFDGDKGHGDRLRSNRVGKPHDEVEKLVAANDANNAALNRLLLRSHGAPEEDWPTSQVAVSHAVFEDTLETFLLDEWPGVLDQAHRLADEAGDFRPKPDDHYRTAAAGMTDPPALLTSLLDAIVALAP